MEIVKIFFYSESKEDKNGIWKFFNKMESNVFDQVGMNECIYIYVYYVHEFLNSIFSESEA